MGVIGCIVLLILAPVVSSFYHEVRLVRIIRILALTFIIVPFGQQYEVLLRKDFQYKSLAVRDVGVKIFSLVTSVLFAYMGFGVYALVYSQIISTLITTALLILLGFRIHKPGFVMSIRDIRKSGFISFSLYQMGERIINYFNAQLDVLIIGKFLGVNALGLYTVAKNLALRPVLLINPSIVNVAVSLLSRIKNDVLLLKNAYMKIVQNVTFLNAYVYAFIFFFSQIVIFVFLGKQWAEASFCLHMLSISGLVISIGNPVGALQVACGRPDKGFYFNILMLVLVPVAIFIGKQWGIDGVAFSMTCLRLLLLFLSWIWYVYDLLKVRFTEFFGVVLKILLCAFVSAGATTLLEKLIVIESAFISLIIYGITYSILFFILVYLFCKSLLLEGKSFLQRTEYKIE